MTRHAVNGTDAVSNVRRYYELVDSGNVDDLVGLFAPDAEYQRPGYPPLVGHSDLQQFYQQDRIIDVGQHVVNTVVAQGSHIAVAGEFSGFLKNGSTTTLRFADFFTVNSVGLFARRETFFFTPLV